ncbi:MAG: hypothetical protein Q9214_007224 [Letrouitia sp. 1 TL-2023]
MHMMQNNVKCRGCGETFAKGSGLLAHFEWGRCKGRGNNDAERELTRIKPEDLNRNRALTALEMERVTQQKKEGGETGILSTLPAPRLGESVDVGSFAGGVPIDIADQPDYLVNTFKETRDGSIAKYPNLLPIERKGDTSSSESMASTNLSLSKDHFPALNSKNLGKLNTTPGANKTAAWVNEGNISAKTPMSHTTIPLTGYPKVGQSLEDYTKEVGDKTMSQKLFPNAPPTPATPRVPSGGGPSVLPSQSGFSIGTRMHGFDWDPDPFDGKWHCPFKPQGCKKKFESGEKLEDHLMSGEHRGLVTNCPGCLRRFKTPSALTAHLESATTRCSIRESNQYGNTLAQVSGGYLGVDGMHSDGTPFIKDAEKNDIRGIKW